MKRRHTRDPPKIRSSSVRGFNGVRSSVNRFDVISAKRAKFTDPETDCPQDIRPKLSSVEHEATRAPGSNTPKTSEYAFFKKLKKDAGSSCSYPLHKESNQLKNSESSGCAREFTNMFKDSCEDLRSSFLVEKARPITCNFFLSPLANASNSSETTNNVEKSHKGIRSPWFLDKGTGYMDEEVFTVKREKLRQWVADTALPEVEEHCSKGCDLVSVLLNRLFPENDENNHYRDMKPMQMKADTRYCSHAFPKSDKQFHWTQRRDLMEAERERHLDDFCNRSRERILSKWDTKGSDSPSTSYAADIHFQHENKKCGADFDGGTASWITLRDPYLCSNFENYRSIASSRIKELDEFQDLDVSAMGGEPCTLLLDWNLKDGGDLSTATYNPEMNLHSILATSWDDHQQSLDNRFNAGELHSSSFSANLHNFEVGRDLEDENKFLVAELKHFPLTLSSTPRYLNLREDFCTDDTREGCCTFLSPQNHHWIISKLFSEKHHPGLEALLLPSGPDFDLGWKCLSMSGSYSEHSSSYDHGFQSPLKEGPCSYLLTEEEEEDCAYGSTHRQAIAHFAEATRNSHDWFSAKNLQMSLDRQTARPLLLDSSSWLRSEEVYNDDEQIYI